MDIPWTNSEQSFAPRTQIPSPDSSGRVLAPLGEAEASERAVEGREGLRVEFAQMKLVKKFTSR